jgi:probable selenium-dependent hydroxylase accessory protein YqeC
MSPVPLCRALGLPSPAVVAVAGSGGKTSLLAALARELAAAGQAVALTTTTHIFPPPASLAGEPWLWGRAAPGPAEVGRRLAPGRVVAVAAEPGPRGKLRGLSPAQVASLAAAGAWVLVEADGAAGRPLKAWADYEPVWPQDAAPVVVAGAGGLGRPLGPAWVHRPELFAAAGGLAPGQPVTPRALAGVLAGPLGPLRGLEKPAALVVNQADAAAPEQLAGLRRALAAAESAGAGFGPLLRARLRWSPWLEPL